MGIRTEAYAVDLVRFDRFLNEPLGDLLCRYQRDGIEGNERLMFTAINSCDTFDSTPGGSIRAFLPKAGGEYQKPSPITEREFRKHPMLQTSARQHISQGSIYQSSWLLRAFSNCRGIDFIARLIDGHRRWWIGSVLQSADSVLDGNDYLEVESLFRRILRGYDCGYEITEGDIGLGQRRIAIYARG